MKQIVFVMLLATTGACRSQEEQTRKDEPSPQDAKVKLTELTVNQLANGAYPQWSMANSGKTCPDLLTDLSAYSNQSSQVTHDAWDRPLKMKCGPSATAGAIELVVWSAGPDGRDGTSDDIRSSQ